MVPPCCFQCWMRLTAVAKVDIKDRQAEYGCRTSGSASLCPSLLTLQGFGGFILGRILEAIALVFVPCHEKESHQTKTFKPKQLKQAFIAAQFML